MAKVWVIDDDDIGRHGRAAIFERLGHDVVATGFAGLEWGVVGWPPEAEPEPSGETRASVGGDPVDLVFAAIRPDLTGWDRFATIPLLGRVRPALAAGGRVAALLLGPAIGNPLLRLRLHRAGVDELLSRPHVSTEAALRSLVTGELQGMAPKPSNRELALAGVGPDADPEALITWVLEKAEGNPAYLRAFDPLRHQNQSGLSRRQAINLRTQLARRGRVVADPSRMAGGPVRDQSLPRWSEVVTVTNLCRGYPLDGIGRVEERPDFDDGGWWEAASS